MRNAILISLSLLIVLAGCHETYGELNARVAFEDSSGASSRSSARSANSNLARASGTPDSATFDVIEDTYSILGNRVGAYTPTEFRLHVNSIYLYQIGVSGSFVMLNPFRRAGSEHQPELFQANFVEDIELVSEWPILPGFYDGMGINFGGGRAGVSSGVADGIASTWLEESVVTVTIPGYEDVWTAGSSIIDLSAYGFGVYESVVKNADNSISFGLNMLQPGYISTNYGVSSANYYVGLNNFFYARSEYYAVVTGEVGHPSAFDSADIGLLNIWGGPVFSGDWGCIVTPFAGITVPDDIPEITFTVSWDLDGIIEVYDAGTPADKSDDIMILADNFWTRYDLYPSYF